MLGQHAVISVCSKLTLVLQLPMLGKFIDILLVTNVKTKALVYSFDNILFKSLLSNKFRRHENSKIPKPPNRQIETGTTASRRELEIKVLDVPAEIIHRSTRTLSSLGSTGPPHRLVCIGNGNYVPSSLCQLPPGPILCHNK